jgi:hypothetical protein
VQLQSIGGDNLHGYRCHQHLFTVTMCVALSLALARQLVQMPAAAHSIPNISALAPPDLQLEDVGLSRPLWVWIWI